MNFVVIICSVRRPTVMHETVTLILSQDRLPSKILLCVSEADDVLDDTLKLDDRVVRIMSPVKGLTAQRNYAVRMSADDAPDVTVFLDDDIEIETGFLRKMLHLFEKQEDLIGVSAESLIGGLMVSRAKAATAIASLDEIPAGDLSVRSLGKHWSLHGCNMFIRTSILQKELFDEHLPLYSYAEDYDFSIRAARHGQVGRVAGVGFVHLTHSSGRISERRRGYSMVANNLYFLQKRVSHLPLIKAYLRFWIIIVLKETWVSFYRALCGRDADQIDYSGRVRGRLMAVKDILFGKCTPKDILNDERFG